VGPLAAKTAFLLDVILPRHVLWLVLLEVGKAPAGFLVVFLCPSRASSPLEISRRISVARFSVGSSVFLNLIETSDCRLTNLV